MTPRSVSSMSLFVSFPLFLSLFFILTGCTNKKLLSEIDPPAPQRIVDKEAALAAPREASFAPRSSVRATPVLGEQEDGASAEERGGKAKHRAGEDPRFAKQHGWPVAYPEPLPGAIMPANRIVAYYGNPLSRRMGVLGEYDKEEMLRRLRREVERWSAADPSLPVRPALHLIAVVAQGDAGKSGKYRMVMPDAVINQVYGWAREANALLFIDIQTGHDDIRALLPRFEWILRNPDVHLGIDPEFNLISSGARPGSRIGTYDAADVNFASGYLRDLVKKHSIPPKTLVVHRFTRNMVTNAAKIRLSPEVQIVMNMDGWGAPWLKRDSYRDYIVREPVQFTGFKLFYHNDTKSGEPLLTPREVLKLNPKPVYIQYQ